MVYSTSVECSGMVPLFVFYICENAVSCSCDRTVVENMQVMVYNSVVKVCMDTWYIISTQVWSGNGAVTSVLL